MNTTANRRKATNLFIEPRAYLSLAIPLVLLICLSVIIVSVLNWQISEKLIQITVTHIEHPHILHQLRELASVMLAFGQSGLIILGVVGIILWLASVHLIIGPMLSMRHHIKNLNEGKFESRILLRKYDQFRTLENDLNQLAETLERTRSSADDLKVNR